MIDDVADRVAHVICCPRGCIRPKRCVAVMDCLDAAHALIEAYPELRPPQFTSEGDGVYRLIVPELPWLRGRTP